MKLKFLGSLVAGVMLLSAASHAENISVGANVGLFGIGGNIKYKTNNQMGVRVGFDMFKVNDVEIEDDEVKYIFDAKVQDITLLADWHPWKGSFRTSMGLLINNSELDGDITPNSKVGDTIEFDFNGKHYEYKTNELGSIHTTADFDPVAPYVGIGWDTSFNKDKGFGFTFDLGIAFQGSMNTDYSLKFGDSLDIDKETADMPDGPVKEAAIARIKSKQKEIKDELETELDKEMKTLQDELDKYEIMPYISIGFNYKF
jgi:outer membrane protein W